ncbi:MAG: DUF72 domain-containing protein [Chloroflexota bacterium]
MIRVGTSGYQYPAWWGRFYPHGLAQSEMLAFYAARFDTVEINYTFYRLPTVPSLLGWAAATPPRFKLALRAPRRITHILHLKGASATTTEFLRRATVLRDKLAVVLFQISAEHELDVSLLGEFLAGLPPRPRAAFEFRNPDWLTDAVFDRLRQHNVALCVSHSETLRTPALRTADFAYFRLRDVAYQQTDLERWAAVLQEWDAGGCEDIYVYFKHEATGTGPEFAKRLVELVGLR